MMNRQPVFPGGSMEQRKRIELTDTQFSAMSKLSGGNPGAINVLTALFESAPVIDPDAMLGGMAPIFGIDSLHIHGSDIWVLFKDCCGQSFLNLQTVLRANQLGFISEHEIRQAIANEAPLDCAKLLTQVRERLPRFGATDHATESRS